MKETLRIGLIGAGMMGVKHSRIYTEMPHACLVGIADIKKNKAQAVAEQFHVKHVVTDYHALLNMEDIDAIHIATPDFLHTEPVIDALKKGKHVLVEKPMATTVEDAQLIVNMAEETGCHVMVNYTHRWAAPYAAAKQIIQDGKIGDAVMVYARKDDTLRVVDWMAGWIEKTSSASYLSTHDIDLVLWFLGTDVESVYALGVKNVLQRMGLDTEDAIQALVRFKNGAIGTFESCWILPKSMPTDTDSFIEIIGEKGTIHIDRMHEGLKVGHEKRYEFPKLSLLSEVQGKLQGGVALCLEHFVESLRKGEKPQPDAETGLKIVKISKAIQLSIARKDVVYIDSVVDCGY